MPVGQEPRGGLWPFFFLAAVFGFPAVFLGYKWLFEDQPNVKGECVTRRGPQDDCYSGETVNMIVSLVTGVFTVGILVLLVIMLVDRRGMHRRWQQIATTGTRGTGVLESAAPIGMPTWQQTEMAMNLVFDVSGERVVVDKVWVPRTTQPGMTAELAYDPASREGVLLALPQPA